MGRLFNRRWKVTIGTLDVSDLDIRFKIEKSTLREPNTCELEIANLNENNQASLQQTNNTQVSVRAGYEDDGDPPPLLFTGDSRRIYTESDGVDFITFVTARDSGRSYNQGRISLSYSPGTSVITVLRDAVSQLGIGEGNLSDFEAAYRLRNGSDSFADGFVASGPARRVVNAIVRGAGLRWSVQNGSLQLQRRGEALQSQATLLTANSGLVDSPTVDDRGKVSAQSLLQPGLDPGRKVVLDSRAVSGDFEIRKVTFTGDTRMVPWYATMELRSLAR